MRVGGTPYRVHLAEGLGTDPGTRERRIANPDAGIVVFGNLLMQPTAVAAVDVGKDVQTVIGIFGAKIDGPSRGKLFDQTLADFGHCAIGQILARIEVKQPPLHEEAGIVGHVHDFRAETNLQHAIDRRLCNADP